MSVRIESQTKSGLGVALPAILLLSLATLAAHAWHYLPFISDDALISLRYAQRLIDGLGLTWTEGPRVEGYTNLLWTLGCAALGAAGVDLIVAARVLGTVAMAAAAIAIVFASRARNSDTSAPVLVGGMSFALAGPIAIWAIGGLEQALLAGLLAWTTLFCYRLLEPEPPTLWQILRPGLLLGLICLTRADGPVLCVAVGLGLIAARGLTRASVIVVLQLAILPVLFVAGQMVFRLSYYGEWVPNSAVAKVAFTSDRLQMGLAYLLDCVIYLAGMTIPAAAALFMIRPLNRRMRFLLVAVLIWLAYVAMIGGDIFPGRRQFVVAIVWLALISARFVEWIASERRFFHGAQWVVATASLALLATVQLQDPQNDRAIKEDWEWDGRVVGNLLRDAFGDQQPLLAVDAAGCVPYFSGLPSLDMLGINDRHIARSRPSGFGTGMLGHDLGDGKYVLSCEPDLVLFQIPGKDRAKPIYVSGLEMLADPAFERDYRELYFEGHDPYPLSTRIWVRIDSPKIGIVRSSDRVVVPGFMFADSRETTAQLAPESGLQAVIRPGRQARFARLELAPGRWRVRVDADKPTRVRIEQGSIPLADGTVDASFSVVASDSAPIDIEIRPTAASTVRLDRVVFEAASE